jgi:MFS family permease
VTGDVQPRRERAGRALLAVAAVALGFAAADNYVVVLALPNMMGSVGLSTEDLHEAAPIVSGFMLGYIGVLPLIGRISDVRGRRPVLLGSLVVFGLGSLVTATSYDMALLVAGRAVLGIGAGGLLPVTLALVADSYPARRRAVPLGVVGAVQELGNVAGPVYGAAVLALSGWRAIFWINLVAAAVLGVGVALAGRRPEHRPGERPRPDLLSFLLVAGASVAMLLVMTRPGALLQDLTWGTVFIPVTGHSRWSSPLALAAFVLVALLLLRSLRAARPLLDVRAWLRTLSQVDLLGTALLGLALAGIILAFASAEPTVQIVSRTGAWLLVSSLGCLLLFWRHNSRARLPLVPHGVLTARPAWGSLVVSLLVGVAVVAALVDIPVFARLTVYHDSQLRAALVLVRFLVGLPVGAYAGGLLSRRLPATAVAAAGMTLAATGFAWMGVWSFDALRSEVSSVPLVLAGLGVGLAMAPVNAALLASTPPPTHGLSSALLVVARTVGKLVGISLLTTIGLNRYYAARADVPAPSVVCGTGETRCGAYSRLLQEAVLVELHTVFLGAAASCLLAAGVALVVLRGADTRAVRWDGSWLG